MGIHWSKWSKQWNFFLFHLRLCKQYMRSVYSGIVRIWVLNSKTTNSISIFTRKIKQHSEWMNILYVLWLSLLLTLHHKNPCLFKFLNSLTTCTNDQISLTECRSLSRRVSSITGASHQIIVLFLARCLDSTRWIQEAYSNSCQVLTAVH